MPFSPTYCAITGRAATALYALFRHLGTKGTLLAPANVCYAALYPALYAGWNITFCDVNPHDGNITLPIIEEAVSETNPQAVLVPHMYGEPVSDFEGIVSLCKDKNIVLIEDAASAMGASAAYPVGSLSDYCIYSTGYAKPVDAGFGGMLTSEHDPLNWFEDQVRDLPLLNSQIEQTETLFSRLYRVLRNNPDRKLDVEIYRAFYRGSRDAFLYNLAPHQKETVLEAVSHLDEVVAQRRSILHSCEKVLTTSGFMDAPFFEGMYPYSPGAVPWRLTFFVAPQAHEAFIKACLGKGLPVSDWYPCVTPMFENYNQYPGALSMDQRIVNFPLTQKTAECVCPQLSDILRSIKL
ncbi:MAG: DegT/DnrJ/EryC1/StrS aminotransferase family protein [Coriobacteriales bacterium]|nr:DegT/DnrJ/EryC1/StrS aminotransferase family protein [Coriobacteriales bacterium]